MKYHIPARKMSKATGNRQGTVLSDLLNEKRKVPNDEGKTSHARWYLCEQRSPGRYTRVRMTWAHGDGWEGLCHRPFLLFFFS